MSNRLSKVTRSTPSGVRTTAAAVILAAVILGGSAAGLHGTSEPPPPSSLALADARLHTALAGAAKAAQAAPDAEAQNARLQAADAALDAMAILPARDRADLDRKAGALLFVADFEVQNDWRLARSIAHDALRLDGASGSAMP